MGGCFSDVNGGKAAVGGAQRGAMAPLEGGGYDVDFAQNEAVDHFYKVQGFQPLFTHIEV